MSIIQKITSPEVKAMDWRERWTRAAQAAGDVRLGMSDWKPVRLHDEREALILEKNLDELVSMRLIFSPHFDQVSLVVFDRATQSNHDTVEARNMGYHQDLKRLTSKVHDLVYDNAEKVLNRTNQIHRRVRGQNKLEEITNELTKGGTYKQSPNAPEGWEYIEETEREYSERIKAELFRQHNGEVEAKITFKMNGDDLARVLPQLRELLNG